MDFIFQKSQKKNNTDYGSVYARIRGKGINKKYSLGFTIKSTEWNRLKQLKYSSSSYIKSIGIKYEQFFNILLEVKNAFENSFNPSTARPTINLIKANCIDNNLLKHNFQKTRRVSLLRDYMKQYIEDLQSGQRLKWRQAVKVSEGYVANHKSALKAILLYEREKQINITLCKVSTSFQRSFVAFLRDRKLSPNTINTRMRSIKIIMQAAYKDKLTQNDDFRSNEFVPLTETTDDIFLNHQQIKQMINFDVKSACLLNHKNAKAMRYLEYSRDIFVMGCFTGQRVSDYTTINKQMKVIIDQKEFIKLTQKKTGVTVLIPCNDTINQILEKYNGVLPYMSLNTFRKNLKLLGEMLGWTYRVPLSNRQNSPRFCDMMSTHTARRSFATNTYMAGVPVASIMSVTGHTSEKNFRKYIKLSTQEKALIAAKDFEKFHFK